MEMFDILKMKKSSSSASPPGSGKICIVSLQHLDTDLLLVS